MFTLLTQVIFSLLVLIYALIPGHNFGLAIIAFTIVIRLLMWPLVKKQLHHAKAIRELQPEIKKIKAASKGNRQKESQLTMELYKEKEINPFASLGIILVQIPILIGLYYAVKRIVEDPAEILTFSYSFLTDLPQLQQLAEDINRFDETLFGLVDLTRTAIGSGGIYWPAIALVALSAGAQFLQSRQLMPKAEDSRSLKKILKEAGQGKTADQQEVSAAVGRSMLYLIPAVVFLFGLSFPAALPLYWFVSSGVAYLQQSRILKKDAQEAGVIAAASEAAQPEAEAQKTKPKKKRSASKKSSKKKRRK